MEHRPITLSSYLRLVRHNRNFRLLWLAQIVSELGDWFYTVAIYSLLLEYTGSARAVSLAFVLQVLPQFFIAPTAGVLHDRLSRKQVMIFADWCRAFIVLGMLLVRTPEAVPFLYVLLFLETIMWALFEPGRSAVIPNIATSGDIPVANALSSTTWSFNLAVGSAVGGLMAAAFGRDAVFVINAVSFVVSALLIARMKFHEPHIENRPPFHSRELADFRPIIEGVRYVRKDARLLVTMFVKAGLGLTGANWVLVTVMGERVFPVGVAQLDERRAGMLGMSILMASRGVGALLGPLIGSYWAGPNPRRLRLGILIGFLAASVGYLLLGAAPTLETACLALVVAHMGGSIIWVFSTTLLQQMTDDRFRGRVFSAEYAFAMLTMSAVNYSAGLLIDGGMTPAMVATGTGLIVLLPALSWAATLRRGGKQRTSVTMEAEPDDQNPPQKGQTEEKGS
jgi:MFS family permease